MKAFEVAEIIEEFAPLDKQEEWDNAGFCIGSPNCEVKGILLGFDCTLSLVKEAIEIGTNMIITHHPLIFHGIKKISPDTLIGSIISLALKNDIVIYAAHTNADKVINGVSGLMADRLGLNDREFLDESGLGIVGELPDPVSAPLLIERVKKAFSLKCMRVSTPVDGMITKVALCGGSGKSLIEKAFESGAQVYMAGDFQYHDFFCEKGFMLMDVGHYESEIDIVNKIMALLKKKIHNFAVTATRNNNNPIYYY